MKTTTRQRLTLTLIGAATIIGASACGTAGTGTGSSTAPSTTAASTASMDPGMSMSGSRMPAPMSPSMAATTGTPSGSTGMAAEATIHIKSFAYTGAESVPPKMSP